MKKILFNHVLIHRLQNKTKTIIPQKTITITITTTPKQTQNLSNFQDLDYYKSIDRSFKKKF